jgi:hypothetical protein
LGRFITKSQEAKTCGGARAVCLCSTNFQTAKSSGGVKMTANTGHHTQRGAAGSAGYEFDRALVQELARPLFVNIFPDVTSMYSLLSSFPSEHVPKA